MREGGTITRRPFRSCEGSVLRGGRVERAYLSVFERSSVKTHGPVGKEGLHLGDEQVTLLKERSHL